MTPLQDGVSADPDAAATAGQGRNGPEMALPSRCLSRRDFLWQTALAVAIATSPVFNSPVFGQMLKDGVAPVPEPHFPSRLFLFVWRNWELANTDRLAQVLETDEKSVLQLGAMLGLPPKPKLSDDQLRRIYITVIRQNWHVLPHQQLIQLLGCSTSATSR